MADQTVGKSSSKTKTTKLTASISKRPKTTMDTEQVNVEPSKEPQSWLSSRSFREYHLWITRQLWHKLGCNNDSHDHDHCRNGNVEKVESSIDYDINNSKNKTSCNNVKHNRNSPSSDHLDKPINDVVTTIHDHDVVNCRVGSIDIISESMTSELKLWSSGSGFRQLQLSSGPNPRRGIFHIAVAIFYLVMYITTPCLALREGGASNCTFPSKWEGTWFISGFQNSIHIKGSQFGYRGKCMASDGDKYLIADGRGCHRCLVIYEKHKNVLQYKESFCKERETLQSLCDQIPGDALLYSLFKENAEPIKCPLRGPFTFTYNRGHGECRSPVSNIESCTEESRLLLSFQACPDVQGTESTVETLTCLADWKDGNSRYLVGLVTHNHAISNEERFRCFVYEKMSTLMIRGSTSSASLKDAEYKLAQSGDATCNGLENAEVGSRIMTLRNRPPDPRCDFPAWLKGPRHWHALKGNSGYIFHQSDGSMHITKANGELETRALCGQINKNVPTEVMAVLNYTTGCKSGFMCMVFYRRDTHVAEIQMGLPASRLEDACAPDYFDILKLPFITLLASSSESQTCPIEGLYSLKGAIGPPYILQRHKRNHNNKGHSLRSHHHHEAHKRLIYRNPDGFSHNRGISSIRSRRNVPLISASASDSSGTPSVVGSGGSATSLISQNAPSTSLITSSRLMEYISKPPNDKIAFGQIGELNETQRNRRDTSGCLNYMGRRQLLIGCTEPHLIEVRPQCTDDNDEVYSCHGSWSENGTVYIVTWHARAQHRICITYRPTEGKSAKLVIGDTCYRPNQKLSDHHLVANVTSFGKCGDTSSAKSFNSNDTLLRTLAAAMLIIIYVTRR